MRDDQQIGSDIQAKITAESALTGQNIQVTVANGVATLNGKVDNDASRALAAADSASVDGVRTVVNNLVVAPSRAAKPAPVSLRRSGGTSRKWLRAAPPPPPPPPAAAAPAQEPVQVVPRGASASSSAGGQDSNCPCRDGDSDSHDRYAG